MTRLAKLPGNRNGLAWLARGHVTTGFTARQRTERWSELAHLEKKYQH